MPIRGFAIEVIVTNGQAGRGASPIKTERDRSAIFRRIWQARDLVPLAVLQEFLGLDGEHSAAVTNDFVLIRPPGGERDVAAEFPLRRPVKIS